ncbi:hypothetical protein TNIN_353561 [Trichonephila inaurata madagascariensis]|uniref:Endonuclease/exonuclease/phosphatase domain-containing protein n=1 Tax=Trichonephila inaurata madagascariensis TaxID=2747483 RepID=A0A8X6XLU7_9ARAC|nr:hypothetical protein TNIN_353561 [Trichonephila inaurata madagascariensis]
MRVKLDQILDLADKHDVQIIALQETKLKEHSFKYITTQYIVLLDPVEVEVAWSSSSGIYSSRLSFLCRIVTLSCKAFPLYGRKKSIDIFNMYHPRNEAYLSVNFLELSNKSTIFLGDLSAKHLSWGYSSNNQKHRDLLEAADHKA